MSLTSAVRLTLQLVSLGSIGEQRARTSQTDYVSNACFVSHGRSHVNHIARCNDSMEWPPLAQWQYQDNWLLDLMDVGEPVVLSGTPADTWLARTSNKWTPEYLQRAVPLFQNVYSQPRGLGPFLYHEIDPEEEVAHQEWLYKRHKKVNISSERFFNVARANTDELVYLALHIKREWPDMLTDLNLTSFKTHSDDSVEPNVWIASPDVVAQAHYDCNHNIYVQLHGRKTFALLPPWAVDACYLHPRYHPSARQCQVSFTTLVNSTSHCIEANRLGLANKTCGLSRIDRLDIALNGKRLQRLTLSEGDVFYLPPGWFHEVISEETSVSISLWGWNLPVWLEIQFEAEEAVLPFEEEWDTLARCIWVARFILVVLEASFALRFDGDAHGMALKRLHTLLNTRYVIGDIDGSSWTEVWSRLKLTDKLIVEQLQAMRPCDDLRRTLETDELGEKLLRYAQPVAAIYAKLPDGIFQKCLDDYVELLSKFAVGVKNIPLMVAAILDQCS